MKPGTPPFSVVITDAHDLKTTFTSEDLDLEPEIEEPSLYVDVIENVVLRPTSRVLYYKLRGITESITMTAPGVQRLA